MKTFKHFIVEKGDFSPPTAVDKVRDRINREKESDAERYSRELQRAKEQDFRKKLADTKAKQIKKNIAKSGKAEETELPTTSDSVNEYLEDGTDELVNSYKNCLPGQK